MGILLQSGKNPDSVYVVTQLSCADSKQMAPWTERHLNLDFFSLVGHNSLLYMVQQCLEASPGMKAVPLNVPQGFTARSPKELRIKMNCNTLV